MVEKAALQPRRVLVVETQSEPGGMWHYATSLSRALAEHGLDVTLATTEPFEAFEGQAGLRMRSLGERVAGSRPGAPHWPRRALGQIVRWARLHAVVREVRPDLVHVHNLVGKFDFLGFRWLRALGLPIVLTAHEPRPDSGATGFDWARYRAADAILVHSMNAVEDLVRGGIPADRVRRVHHGSYLHLCPEPTLSAGEARRLIGLREDHRVVLFFGTIDRYKGLDILIDAFARIADGMPAARLVIAGEPLEPFAPYSARIRDRGLEEKVVLDLRYIPFPELPRYFLSADVVAFPYRRIYQSGVLQLAYAYERPVVVTPVGGLGEVVAGDQSGLVAPPEDAPGLAAAIRSVLVDGGAAEMGRRGRRAAENKYAWHAVVRDIMDVYRGVAEREDRPAQEVRASLPRGS